MLFDSCLPSKKSLPAALFVLVLGLLLLSCAIGWQHAIGPLLHLSAAMDDFLHGFCLGLALTLEATAVVLLIALTRAQRTTS